MTDDTQLQKVLDALVGMQVHLILTETDCRNFTLRGVLARAPHARKYELKNLWEIYVSFPPEEVSTISVNEKRIDLYLKDHNA